jgi:methylthioribose-1-phosphate isomerase
MSDALDSLASAVDARKPVESRLAAIGAAVASLDLQLRHRAPAEVDLARLDLQAAMLGIDAAAEDLPAVRSDVANLDWIRDRIAHTLDDADRSRIDTAIVEAIGAAGDEDLAAVGEVAAQMRELLRERT